MLCLSCKLMDIISLSNRLKLVNAHKNMLCLAYNLMCIILLSNRCIYELSMYNLIDVISWSNRLKLVDSHKKCYI